MSGGPTRADVICRSEKNTESQRAAAFSKLAPLVSAAAQLTAAFATFRTPALPSRWTPLFIPDRFNLIVRPVISSGGRKGASGLLSIEVRKMARAQVRAIVVIASAALRERPTVAGCAFDRRRRRKEAAPLRRSQPAGMCPNHPRPLYAAMAAGSRIGLKPRPT
jgi:hypothetical protein